MPPKYIKILLKLPLPFRRKLQIIIDRIEANTLLGLDIKKMKGEENQFRCRVGNTRIVFIQIDNNTNRIIAIGPRGDIYK